MRQRNVRALVIGVLATVACRDNAAPTAVDGRTPIGPAFETSTAQAAPTLLGPADSAGVTVPFTISWSSVLDTSAINGGYNWQVSTSPTFSTLVLQDASRPAEPHDVVSGLANGTYYWRVNAVSSGLVTSEWSATRSVVVTGAGPGTPGTPALGPTQGYSTFHPEEVIRFHWSRVEEAVTYRLEVSNDIDFPVGTLPEGTVTFWRDNIPDTTDGFRWGMGEGTYFARVFAVDADNPQEGIRSLPSNVIEFTVFYDNPIGPAPVPTAPADGATLTLPITLEWAHVPNPQPLGYDVEISSRSDFSTSETSLGTQLTEPKFLIKSMSSGTKFWRVRSMHGMSSPTQTAVTAWSAVRSFTVSTAPPTPVSITPLRNPLYSGDDTFVEVQLTAGAPSGGATVALSSSHPEIAPVPSTLSFPETHALAQFQMRSGEVTTATTVTLTATLNGVSATSQFTLHPATLKSLTTPSPNVSGGVAIGATLMLNGIAPAGGATVSLSSSSPAATPPSSVTISAGSRAVPLSIPTSEVAAITSITLSASWNGATLEMPVTLHPAPPPTAVKLFPATVIGGEDLVDVRVEIGSTASFDQQLRVSRDNATVIPSMPSSVLISANSSFGAIRISPAAVSATTVVAISATGGGVTQTAALTVTPPDAPSANPALTSFTVSPTSVEGGTSATGAVSLASAAPSGGTVVSLGSNQPSVASVPPSVTVPAGATSASFTITTFSSSGTTVQLNAKLDDTILFASLGVGPPPTPTAPSLISPANGAKPAQPVTFDWSDVTGGASYTIEIDDNEGFPAPLVASQTVTTSTATITNLPSRRLWWRVRARNSAGVWGPYSSIRRFEPQSAPATPALSSIALSPTSVVGGTASRGTATLSAAAPSGGAVVSLSSGNATVAATPASVTVPAGATSAGFDVTTSAVSANQSVTISGSYGGTTRSATLTVTPEPPPAALSAVSVSPSTVTGGSSSTGTITLTSGAPSGGLAVSLTSSNAAAGVPASVTVPAGSSSASFAVTTSSVTSSTGVTITAAAADVTRTAMLTVEPASVTLTAPSLLSPSDDARFSSGATVTFDWNDVSGAASYTIQIDDDETFPSPFIVNQTVTASQFTTGSLPTRRMWWRVRAVAADGTIGPWSSVRRFELK